MKDAELKTLPIKILIASADLDFTDWLAAFKAEQWEVLTATSGQTGFALIEKERPNLVIVSSSLSDMSGFDFIKNSRNHPLIPTPTIFFVYPRATPKKAMLSETEIGADLCLSQWIKNTKLVIYVKICLSQRKAPLRPCGYF